MGKLIVLLAQVLKQYWGIGLITKVDKDLVIGYIEDDTIQDLLTSVKKKADDIFNLAIKTVEEDPHQFTAR